MKFFETSKYFSLKKSTYINLRWIAIVGQLITINLIYFVFDFKFNLILENSIILIGVGGVSSGHDAYQKIKLGASLVQLYSAFAFQGPSLINRINKELVQLVKKDGFNSISEAIGSGV